VQREAEGCVPRRRDQPAHGKQRRQRRQQQEWQQEEQLRGDHSGASERG
jgi:hypothetical protein